MQVVLLHSSYLLHTKRSRLANYKRIIRKHLSQRHSCRKKIRQPTQLTVVGHFAGQLKHIMQKESNSAHS